jgi:hypothetical protein
MARLLNGGVLPPGYYAVPFLDRDGPVEIDVAALREFDTGETVGTALAPKPWAPASPGIAVAVEWPSVDEVRVEVFADDGDPRLAATVELVSLRNKDRVRACEAFAAKCANHLQSGCGLAVVDVVTTRRADLHADLLAALGADLSSAERRVGFVVGRVISVDWPRSGGTTPRLAGGLGNRPAASHRAVMARGGCRGAVGSGSQPHGNVRGFAYSASGLMNLREAMSFVAASGLPMSWIFTANRRFAATIKRIA